MPDVRACPTIMAGQAADGRWTGRENGIEATDEFLQAKYIWFIVADTTPNPFDLPKM